MKLEKITWIKVCVFGRHRERGVALVLKYRVVVVRLWCMKGR